MQIKNPVIAARNRTLCALTILHKLAPTTRRVWNQINGNKIKVNSGSISMVKSGPLIGILPGGTEKSGPLSE